MNKLHDDLERWLIHENYLFEEQTRKEDNFSVMIKDVGSYNIPIEIFEPKKQPGILVFGGKMYMKNRQTARYLKLNDTERQKFHNSLKEYCDSIRAIHKIFQENGKVVIEVYLVLDNVDRFTQQMVVEALGQVTQMSEKTNQFIMKTF